MRKFLSYLILFAAVSTALGSIIHVLGPPENYPLPLRAKYLRHLTLVRVHGVSSALVLLLGPILWWLEKSRKHRWIGRFYLSCCAVGSVTGLYLGTMALGGPLSQLGFCLMALLWSLTGGKAIQTVRQGRQTEHRVWVIRNFALAFGAVFLRLYLNLGAFLEIDHRALYPAAVWVCWGLAMALGEILIKRLL